MPNDNGNLEQGELPAPENGVGFLFTGKEVKAQYAQQGEWHDVIFDYFSLSETGQVIGRGVDEVGSFTILGEFKMPTPEIVTSCIGSRKRTAPGSIAFIKQYIGQHQVEYAGKLSMHKGLIKAVGTWRIGNMYDRFRMTLDTRA